MIGEIWTALTPCYNRNTKRMEYKGRPALMIAEADQDDYVALPVSRVTLQQNIDQEYDIPVGPATHPNLNLTDPSYVRTHKQTIIHRGEIGRFIGDLRAEYPDLYLEILEKREQFNTEITEQAIS